MTQDTNTASGTTEPDNVTRQPAWSLGYINGNWRDIDHQGHDGVMRIVWKKGGEERTPECEALAHAVIAALNGVADHDGLAGQILRSGGTGGWPGKYFADATHTLRASHEQASSQAGEYPAPDEIINMAREQGLPETEIEGVFRVNADDLCRVADAILAAPQSRGA